MNLSVFLLNSRGFHKDACLLQAHSFCLHFFIEDIWKETLVSSSQVWWGSLEGHLLLSVITVRFSVFLSKEFKVWATPRIPDVVVSQRFWNIRTKMQSPKVQLSPSCSNQTWTKIALCSAVLNHAASLAARPAQLNWHTFSWTLEPSDSRMLSVRPKFVFFFFERLNFWKLASP